jgi:hypothetical protein
MGRGEVLGEEIKGEECDGAGRDSRGGESVTSCSYTQLHYAHFSAYSSSTPIHNSSSFPAPLLNSRICNRLQYQEIMLM